MPLHLRLSSAVGPIHPWADQMISIQYDENGTGGWGAGLAYWSQNRDLSFSGWLATVGGKFRSSLGSDISWIDFENDADATVFVLKYK